MTAPYLIVAMEPAVYRREHLPARSPPGWAAPVAMEPAVYRREHYDTEFLEDGQTMSQWSPPFIGGSTLAHDRAVPDRIVAMEPAVYRREHRCPGRLKRGGETSRNGARRL